MQTYRKLSHVVRGSVIICTLMAALNVGAAYAFEECFLQIEGVDGGSIRRGHEHAVDLTAYSWEEKSDPRSRQADARGGPVHGRSQMDFLHVTMRAGKAGPVLMLLAANGGNSRQAVLECTGPNAAGAEAPIYRWVLSDVTVNSFQSGWTGGQNNSEPLDQVALGFGKISYEYVPAAIKAEWDVARNSGGLVGGGAATTPPKSH